MVDIFYNPIVGANLMSTSFAHTYLGAEPLALTNKSLRNNSRSILKGHRILHNTTIDHDDAVMALNFHVFDIQDFDILIGHSLEKLFINPSKTGDPDVKLGRDTFSIPITRAKNSVTKFLPYLDPPKEIMSVLPFHSPKSSLEKDAKLFIEEEDNLG